MESAAMPKRYRDIAGDGGSDVLVQVEEMSARLRARMARVRRKLAVTSGKGGVGKSVLTANLAAILAGNGWRVGVLDADLNGPCMADLLGARGQGLRLSSEGLHPAEGPLGMKVLSMDLFLPEAPAPLLWEAPSRQNSFIWRGSMEATALRELLTDTAWGDLDILLLDLPPGGPTLPTLAGLLGDLDGALVVTIPSEISRLVVGRAVEMARAHRVRLLGLVENMAGYVCPDCGAVGHLFAEETPSPSELVGLPILGRIPFDSRIAWCADRGNPYILEHPETAAGQALRDLGARVGALLVLEGAGR
jgi:ATP-binding protein involved in chromosome partitioning